MGLNHYKLIKGGLIILLATICSAWSYAQPEPVTGLEATAYDHHIELDWDQSPNPFVQGYRIYGRQNGGEYEFLGFTNNVTTTFIDFLGDWDATGSYYIQAIDNGGNLSVPSDTISGTTFEMTDEELLDMVQAYTLRYFYDFGHPVSGLARERNTTNTVTSGGSGFGIMALIVGAERGFITYEEAFERTEKIVNFLMTVPRFRGAFSHWMNGATGQVIPFSQLDDGGDLVETAFLIQGLLTARQYYSGDLPAEVQLRENITQLWEEVNWNWYRRLTQPVLTWHWSPQNEWAINLPIRGFNESHIIYLLAIAAPNETFDIPASLYHTGWAGGDYANNIEHYGYPLEVGRGKGGPLFFSHYSYLGFDPRGIADQYTNYFARNTAHSFINYEHCIDNPYNRTGYSSSVWGITASDDPFVGYLAHSPNSAQLDNGTIAPTAALSSMPYTPGQSMRALKHFYRELGDRLWGRYGFKDAFNLGANWFADSYLAIDQGPIICMIENYRSGLLWDLFMQNPEIQPALDEIGFTPDSTVIVSGLADVSELFSALPQVVPQPLAGPASLHLTLKEPTVLSADLISAEGQLIQQLFPRSLFPAGAQQISFSPESMLSPGTYFLQLNTPIGRQWLPIILTN
ncbi:MAG: glucoamylase family protein [Bacteroidota bacterium]